MQQEFSIFGLTLEKIAIGAGCFLVLWACAVFVLGNSQSITSWIPAFLGGPIFICGYLALAWPNKKKALDAPCCCRCRHNLARGLRFFSPHIYGTKSSEQSFGGAFETNALLRRGILA